MGPDEHLTPFGGKKFKDPRRLWIQDREKTRKKITHVFLKPAHIFSFQDLPSTQPNCGIEPWADIRSEKGLVDGR